MNSYVHSFRMCLSTSMQHLQKQPPITYGCRLKLLYFSRLYYAQSLFQAGMFDESFKVTADIDELDTKNKHLKEHVLQLQSAIRYTCEDFSGAQSILLQRKASQESTLNDEGCLLYKVVY